MKMSVGAALITGGFNGVDLLKISSKCFTHLFHCSSVSVIGLSFLLLTVHSGLLYFVASFFVVSEIGV